VRAADRLAADRRALPGLVATGRVACCVIEGTGAEARLIARVPVRNRSDSTLSLALRLRFRPDQQVGERILFGVDDLAPGATGTAVAIVAVAGTSGRLDTTSVHARRLQQAVRAGTPVPAFGYVRHRGRTDTLNAGL
jgi:hypothetical protein